MGRRPASAVLPNTTATSAPVTVTIAAHQGGCRGDSPSDQFDGIEADQLLPVQGQQPPQRVGEDRRLQAPELIAIHQGRTIRLALPIEVGDARLRRWTSESVPNPRRVQLHGSPAD